MEKIELAVSPYSWFNDGSGIDKSLYDIFNKYKALGIEIKGLREDNKRLKNENYKDEELSRLKKENKELKNQISRGFTISEKETEKIKTWLNNHDCPLELTRDCKIGGPHVSEYRFGIIPGIGYNGYVKCACGKEFCFRKE